MYACWICCNSLEINRDGEREQIITQQPKRNKQKEDIEQKNEDVQQKSGSFSDREDQQQTWFTLTNRVEKLEKENRELNQNLRSFSERENQQLSHVEKLEKENKELKQILSPDQLEKLHSKRMLETGSFEDLNDKFSNTKLSELHLTIKKKEWFHLYKALHKRFKDELCVLSFISEIMKSIYEDCKTKAVDGLAYGRKDPSLDAFSVNEFRKVNGQTDIALTNITMELKRKYNLSDRTGRKPSLRKRYGSMDSTFRDRSTRQHEDSDAVDSNLVTFGSVNEYSKFGILSRIIHEDPDILETFELFFVAVVECSWLMVVSDPPTELNFGEQILGKTLDKKMDHHFEKYPTNKLVTTPKIVGTIIQIVWPELNDNFGTHKRGLVVTVDESSGTEV